jgi:hypothetical protein
MRNVQSIEWHEECLLNRRKSVELLKQELDRLLKRLHMAEAELSFRELQIEEAKRLKKTKFDADKFLFPKEGRR